MGRSDPRSAREYVAAALDALWTGEAPDGEEPELYVIEQLRSAASELGAPWQPPLQRGTARRSTITIVIPDYLPDRRIGGNSRGHTAGKSTPTRIARDYGRAYGLQSLAGAPDGLFPLRGPCSIRYIVRGSRMDGDNIVRALKPVLDGVVEAGVLEDDSQISRWRLVMLPGAPQVAISLSEMHPPPA